jgi:hypothetical protein
MYSRYQIQAAISPSVYTTPSSNFYAIKPVSSSFMEPNFMMWFLNVSIWDQVNISIFDNLNIVKNYVFSLRNSSCYISANLYVTFIELLLHQTSMILFHGPKFHDVIFNSFDMGSSQLFDFLQSEYCEKLTCILVTKFNLLYLL